MLDATLHYYILCTLTDFSGSLYRWENEAQCGLLSFLALGHNGTRVCTLVIWAQSFSVFDSFAILGSNAWFTLVRLGEMGGRKCHQTAINMHCPMGKQVNLGRVQGPETWGLLLDLFCFFSESQSWVARKRMNTHTHTHTDTSGVHVNPYLAAKPSLVLFLSYHLPYSNMMVFEVGPLGRD